MTKMIICLIVGCVFAFFAFFLTTKMGIANTPAIIMGKSFPVGLLTAALVGCLMAYMTPKLVK